MYPLKIRIKDEELNKILNRLAHDRTVTINGDKKPIQKLKYKIKPIRKDIFIGYDRTTYESNISFKKPDTKLKIIRENTKKHYHDWEFHL
jgi:hypothetical protein